MTHSQTLTHRQPARVGCLALSLTLCLSLGVTLGTGQAWAASRIMLLGLGDSLGQGTMDATDNATNTQNAYFQKVAKSLAQRIPVISNQPLLSVQEQRLSPFLVPTNLGVDGTDLFSVEGIEYYKRAGTDQSFISGALLADNVFPWGFTDMYDKVLYPINLLAQKPVSQMDAAIWLLNHAAWAGVDRSVVLFWVGNNDSSTAALGFGGNNPRLLPIPVEQIAPVMPLLGFLFQFGESQGSVSFAPYTQANIERNLTDLQDFVTQYAHLLTRLQTETAGSGVQTEVFLLTLPYYSAVGYLIDSEDLEFYLRKVNPAYTVPPTFKRVTPPGTPITNPVAGDRVSLLTFGLMYTLLHTGFSVEYVNRILEVNGQQRDGLVLSEVEQGYIMSRIDDFNATIRQEAASRGPHVHLIDIGQYLNDALTGSAPIIVGGRTLTRKWSRGGSFTFDGVHPSYTGQALIANFVLTQLNQALVLDAPLYDLSAVMASDPYVDHDGDGWAPGPNYPASGLTSALFLFKDPNDGNGTVQPALPPDVWIRIATALWGEILNIK